MLKATIQHVVEMYHSDTMHDDDYLCGDQAWAHWLNWLQQVDRGVIQPTPVAPLGNRWCYTVLVRERQRAADWLHAQAEQYACVRESLLGAADAYQRVVDCCLAGIGDPASLCPASDRQAEWTSAQRNAQINRLTAAREQEAAAVRLLKSALVHFE